jgi:hypothetical protein
MPINAQPPDITNWDYVMDQRVTARAELQGILGRRGS